MSLECCSKRIMSLNRVTTRRHKVLEETRVTAQVVTHRSLRIQGKQRRETGVNAGSYLMQTTPTRRRPVNTLCKRPVSPARSKKLMKRIAEIVETMSPVARHAV